MLVSVYKQAKSYVYITVISNQWLKQIQMKNQMHIR